ncbi:hypothetical protein POM88_030897 [Heracleum sosnowskyi]|uniref:Uncharacterized protein n=1 Tax=Heracleum sosnowskyi TaxID=360622 RepID=A0AAD8MJ82_9APIA|nr:hypothetical protein POM88_030897 [Heracleum sosnowskyi]
MRYPHNLGYNVVKAFNGADCSLVVQARTIKITEIIVHGVTGLPNGNEIVKWTKYQAAYSVWAEQFPGIASSEITPSMVRNKILESPIADENFKWNFMIMMYNFFIESNQNSFLSRGVLRFSGDIENCGNYNWCRLLIEKLKRTHAYWAEDTKRNFAGPLPFLICLYVSKVQKEGTTFVHTNYPTYRGWSDMLLRERQKYDKNKNCFGEGVIVKFCDVIVELILQKYDDGPDLTMRAIAVSECPDLVVDDIVHDYEESALILHDIVLRGDLKNTDSSNKTVDNGAFTEVGFNEKDDTQMNALLSNCSTNTYVTRFEMNLIELNDVYEKCLDNFEVAFALYPTNAKLVDLKEKYNYFFKMFGDSSPISKALCVGNLDGNDRPDLE